MSRDSHALRGDALALPIKERASLALALIESLDDGEDGAEIEAVWATEIEHRVADLEAGRTKTLPAEEVFARARARLGQDRG